jgi:hypothetical protein
VTSDGITTTDWDRIKALAARFANAICSDRSAQAVKCRNALLVSLDKLEHKYGKLPSIIATRADYVSDVSESIGLLKKAYSLAEKMNDRKNLTHIASSLAELYLIDQQDRKNGKLWLVKLKACLKRYFDTHEFDVYKTLQKMIGTRAQQHRKR